MQGEKLRWEQSKRDCFTFGINYLDAEHTWTRLGSMDNCYANNQGRKKNQVHAHYGAEMSGDCLQRGPECKQENMQRDTHVHKSVHTNMSTHT